MGATDGSAGTFATSTREADTVIWPPQRRPSSETPFVKPTTSTSSRPGPEVKPTSREGELAALDVPFALPVRNEGPGGDAAWRFLAHWAGIPLLRFAAILSFDALATLCGLYGALLFRLNGDLSP